MSLYKQYLQESYKEYNYRIKTVVPLDSKKMDCIERVLDKYDLKDITSPRRTPIQENPLEFYDVFNTEVYILDTTLGMPASPYVLQQEMKNALMVPEEHIVIRGDNDPIELYTKQLNDEKEFLENGEKRKPRLSTNEEYDDDEQIKEEPGYGDAYNEKFLSRIARARMDIKTDVKSENAEFNKDQPGVKPHYGGQVKSEVKGVAPEGNYDNDEEVGIR